MMLSSGADAARSTSGDDDTPRRSPSVADFRPSTG
jgi:hypothetical protein